MGKRMEVMELGGGQWVGQTREVLYRTNVRMSAMKPNIVSVLCCVAGCRGTRPRRFPQRMGQSGGGGRANMCEDKDKLSMAPAGLPRRVCKEQAKVGRGLGERSRAAESSSRLWGLSTAYRLSVRILGAGGE